MAVFLRRVHDLYPNATTSPLITLLYRFNIVVTLFWHIANQTLRNKRIFRISFISAAGKRVTS